MKYRLFFLDDKSRVRTTELKNLTDPTGYMDGEAQFQALVPARGNPKRYKPSVLPPITGYEEKIDPITGQPYQAPIYALWTDCIQREPYAELEAMTDEEKAQRDADYDAEEIAKEHKEQDDKTQELKDKEKKFKDLGEQISVSFPLSKGDLEGIINNLLTQVFTLYAQNKSKEAGELTARALAFKCMSDDLGADIYSPFIGDGGTA